MSKRSTTGQPKPGQPKPDPKSSGRAQPKLIREYRSKAERESETQQLVIIGVAAAIGIALLILVGALLNDQLIVPNQSVASVNGTNITVSQFVARAKLERALLIDQLNSAVQLFQSFGMDSNTIQQQLTSQSPYSTWVGELQVADQLGNSVLNTMVEDELVRQKAKELNLTVTDAEVDARIQKFFGYNAAAAATVPTATPTPTKSPTPLVSPTPSPMPTATPTIEVTAELTAQVTGEAGGTVTPTFTPFPTATATSTPDATERATQFTSQRDSYFQALRSQTGLTDNNIRDYFRMLALRDKVQAAVITDVQHTAPFVDARHILVADETTANAVLQALQAGGSFDSLAQTLSTDGSKTSGGELGWQPVSTYVKEFADAVTTAKIGDFVGPVKSQFGYHIIQVRAREDRPLTDAQYNQAMSTKFAQYLKDLRSSADTNVQIYDTWTNNVPTDPVWTPSF